VISAPKVTIIGDGQSSHTDPLAPGTSGYYAVIICCTVGGAALLVLAYVAYFSKTFYICPTENDEENGLQKYVAQYEAYKNVKVLEAEMEETKLKDIHPVPQKTGELVF
jgi:esterase/lipase